jgi:transcription elongation factor GreB
MDSPLAKAMLGKELDDEVVINIEAGRKQFFIVDIRY